MFIVNRNRAVSLSSVARKNLRCVFERVVVDTSLLVKCFYSHFDTHFKIVINIPNSKMDLDASMTQNIGGLECIDLADEAITKAEIKQTLKEEAEKKVEQKRLKKVEDVKVWNDILKQNLGQAEYPDLRIFRNRHLTDATIVFRHNAWDNVEWDEEMTAEAKAKVQKNSAVVVEAERQNELEDTADQQWDKFYGIHQNKFFRDRNWLLSEFPELESPYGCSVPVEESRLGIEERRKNEDYPGENSKFKVLEVGCGAGNTVFPYLSTNNNPETYLYACDFSPSAVEIVKTNELYEPKRCTAFVLDLTSKNPSVPFSLGCIDAITMIFVLSAINPEKFDQVLQNLFSFLKPGGMVLFRDYGRYDMAQLRFKEGRCLSDNFYVRGDGTRAYFFTEDEVDNLFKKNGFIKERLLVDKRLQVNRGRQLKMFRVWVQGKFRKPD